MICTSFYSNINFSSNDSIYPDIMHRGNRACKYFEFFILWYLYIRNFLPKDEHIYILDNGSPIKIEEFLKFLNEDYEFIDENSYEYDKEVKIHIKQFKNRLIHRFGATRMLVEFLKMSYFNKQDFVMIESDSLVAYDVINDFEKKDFVVPRIDYYGHSCEMFITFISYFNILNKINDNSLNFYFDHERDNLYEFGEGTFFSLFCNNKVGNITQSIKCIHDCDTKTLKEFLINNSIIDPYLQIFIYNLNKKIDSGII